MEKYKQLNQGTNTWIQDLKKWRRLQSNKLTSKIQSKKVDEIKDMF